MKRMLMVLCTLLCGTVLAFAGGAKEDKSVAKSQDSGAMMSASPSMAADNSMMKTDDSMMADNSMKASDSMMMADPKMGMDLMMAPSTAHKVSFTDLKSAQTLAGSGIVVLFFAAPANADCQTFLKELNSMGQNLTKDITIVVVDLDKNKDLAGKLGAPMSPGFVQIDSNAKVLASWTGKDIATVNKAVHRMM